MAEVFNVDTAVVSGAAEGLTVGQEKGLLGRPSETPIGRLSRRTVKKETVGIVRPKGPARQGKGLARTDAMPTTLKGHEKHDGKSIGRREKGRSLLGPRPAALIVLATDGDYACGTAVFTTMVDIIDDDRISKSKGVRRNLYRAV